MFDDGSEITGESRIADFKKSLGARILRVRLIPERPPALAEVIEAIGAADMIVLGPGSLYTSIMPNLLTEGVARAVAEADAFKIYVLNVMTQDGETEGYTAADHIGALFSNSGERLFDWCLANDREIPAELREKYGKEGAEPVVIDERAVHELGGWPPAGAGGRLGLRLRPARPGRAGARAAAALPREIPHQGIRLRR